MSLVSGLPTTSGRLMRIAMRICNRSVCSKPKKNLAAVLHKVKDLRIEDYPMPKLCDNDVLLHMDCVGICGSDVHYWKDGACGDFVLNAPMVMGHEASGIVVEVGKCVCDLKEGDRVALEPGVPCRLCYFCKTGRYHLCPKMEFCATPPVHGNLATYYKHPADYCFKLPEHMSMEEGALLEPLTCGVHACRRAGLQAGDNVLITGAGPIGLVTLLTAKSMGANKVLLTDVRQSRLDFAKKMGADSTILVTPNPNEKEIVECVLEMLDGYPAVSVDASGTNDTVRLCMLATRSGGVVVLVGMGASEQKLPLATAVSREVDIRGIFRYANEYPISLALASNGQLKPLVTHHFCFEDTVQAYETALKGEGIKVMIHVQPRDANNKTPFESSKCTC